MGDKSAIEWTDATWNPTTGCDRVSPGCANCYAVPQARRNQAMGRALGLHVLPTDPYMRDGDPRTSGPGFGFQMHPARLEQPLAWRRPRRIFVNSMSDLFHPEMTDAFLDQVWAVMALAPQHSFQVLTKRPERMRAYLEDPATYRRVRAEVEEGEAARLHYAHLGAFGRSQRRTQWWTPLPPARWPLPNAWIGTSVENARWRTRIDELRATPGAVRFLSCEPLLGPLVCPACQGSGWDVGTDTAMACCGNVTPDGECRGHCAVQEQVQVQVPCPGPGPSVLRGCLGDLDLRGIDWVIAGGESGPDFRPVDLEWVRQIRDACARQDVAFLFKQVGGQRPKSGGRELDGRTWDEYPQSRTPLTT